MDNHLKKLEKKAQAYAVEWPYSRFVLTPQCIKQYKKELMQIFQISKKDIQGLKSKNFYDIVWESDDYPIINRPFSNIANQIIKCDQQQNPYYVLTEVAQFYKKLSWLLQYGVDVQPIDKNTIYIHHHNRLVHSFDTACNIELIMRNNDFSEEEIKNAVIAGCLHDIATPSFGDLTMKAFPQLKEEQGFSTYMAHYPEISDRVQSHFHTSLEELQSRIKNEGIVGKIIDVADRLAYTARDVSAFADDMLLSEDSRAVYGKRVQEIIRKDHTLFDIIMEISVKDNQIVFENPERLKNILTVRANMHNLVYLNPYLRTREEYFGLILQYLVEEWYLTLEELQKWETKEWLPINEFVIEECCKKGIIDYNPVTTYEFFDTYIHDTKEGAIADIQRFKNEFSSNIPVHYLKTPPFKPGTHYLVRHEGKVQPLADMLSTEELQNLQTLSKATDKHLVLCPKKEFHDRYKKFPKLYDFLCRKAEETYQSLLTK